MTDQNKAATGGDMEAAEKIAEQELPPIEWTDADRSLQNKEFQLGVRPRGLNLICRERQLNEAISTIATLQRSVVEKALFADQWHKRMEEAEAWKSLSVSAVAAENPSVAEYVQRLEYRVDKAEMSVSSLKEEVERINGHWLRVRRKFHNLDNHNQYFERCEDASCHPHGTLSAMDSNIGEQVTPGDRAKLSRIAELEEALSKISRWEMPRTGSKWGDGTDVSYGAAYGSNGERDYVRSIAANALAGLRQIAGEK